MAILLGDRVYLDNIDQSDFKKLRNIFIANVGKETYWNVFTSTKTIKSNYSTF